MGDLDLFSDEMERIKHNEQVRKNIRKFQKTGKLYDDSGKELDIASTVDYERVSST